MQKKSFLTPDDTKKPAEKVTLDTVEIGGLKLQRVTAQPGWKWSVDLKPVFNTPSCPVDHLLYMVSGNMAVRMDDGEELEFSPGDLAHIPAGHDGWDKSGEATVWIEIPH